MLSRRLFSACRPSEAGLFCDDNPSLLLAGSRFLCTHRQVLSLPCNWGGSLSNACAPIEEWWDVRHFLCRYRLCVRTGQSGIIFEDRGALFEGRMRNAGTIRNLCLPSPKKRNIRNMPSGLVVCGFLRPLLLRLALRSVACCTVALVAFPGGSEFISLPRIVQVSSRISSRRSATNSDHFRFNPILAELRGEPPLV